LDPNSAKIRSLRGAEMAMIFQEPMTSLNPSYTIGDQIMEAIILHQKVDEVEAEKRADRHPGRRWYGQPETGGKALPA
jgi:ABC-type microcin C transport system duplicated ATPase subunit YejF